jgi:hypothetical protein
VRAGLIRALGLALALALVLPPPGIGDDALARRLMAVYLYNFTRYIDWPDSGLGEVFEIAVIGDDAFAETLRALERPDKQAEGRPIRVRVAAAADAIGDPQILFIGTEAIAELPRLRSRTAGRPVLLVGNSPGLARRGVAINFFLKPDILGAGEQLRFQIDPAALKRRGLKVMADLYDVAEIVR